MSVVVKSSSPVLPLLSSLIFQGAQSSSPVSSSMSLSMSVGRTERELFDKVEDMSVVALSSTGSRARLMRILRRRCWAAAARTRAQVMSDGARSMPPMMPDTHWAMLGRGAALQA